MYINNVLYIYKTLNLYQYIIIYINMNKKTLIENTNRSVLKRRFSNIFVYFPHFFFNTKKKKRIEIKNGREKEIPESNLSIYSSPCLSP